MAGCRAAAEEADPSGFIVSLAARRPGQQSAKEEKEEGRMNAEVRRKLDMAERALVFIQEHPPEDAGTTPVFEELAERVGHALRLVKVEGEGLAGERAATKERLDVKRSLVTGLLGFLSRAGRAAAKEEPSLAQVFRPIAMATANRLFVARAESMVAAARGQLELLGRYGLTSALLEETERLVNRFVAVSQAAASSRLAHVGANADLTAVTSEIMELIDRIDRLHRHRFRADSDALAAWESAKNVLGPFRRRNGAPAEPSAGAVTPEATPPVEADGGGRTAA
jgi:hypothetical protein